MPLIDSWDAGGSFDEGLSWDVNVGPNPGSIAPYLALIPAENQNAPNFIAMMSFLLQGMADAIAVGESIPGLYDLDVAVGVQLDTVGQWVGVTRNVSVPLTGVFFSWGVAGVGWGQAYWTSGINETVLVVLPDPAYRTLLRARIAANNWDGSIPGAYDVWDIVFAGTGFGILIQDGDNMHMTFALTGPVPDAVTLALFVGGYLDLKPAGVRIDRYYTPAIADAPYFGWGVNNSGIAGWGTGAWGVPSPGH